MHTQVKAKKFLGQHFLTDLQIASDIVESLFKIYPQGQVLEVGPGMGVLTKILLKNKELKTWAAEIDGESVTYLCAHFPEISERLLQESFLEIDLSNRFSEKIAVIGNFPYNISSQIVFHIIDHRDKVPAMVGMFQKEVAERLAAGHGGKDYGILSVLVQAYYKIEYLFTVPEHVFNPPPKVKSGVISMQRRTDDLACDEILFKKIVKAAFNQRRKKLRNAISAFGLNDADLGDFASKRAEELSVDDFVILTNLIANYRNGKDTSG